jgi:hypothetical protein
MAIWKRRQFFKLVSAVIGGNLFRTAPAAAEPIADAARVQPHESGAIHADYDVVIIGGGIAGVSAAIAAARNGAHVALVHERAMLGGNSSSEVRLYPENATAHQVWIKECGVFEEFHTEERVRNHFAYREGIMNCHWDLVLYEWVIREANITLYLNTHMHRVTMKDPAAIASVYCIQLGSEKTFELAAPVFVDTTGDGVLAFKAGAAFRWGREARGEYHEPLAPEQADDNVMGSTLFFRALDTGSPVPFKRPEWAAEFPSEDAFVGRNHDYIEGGYWWIEVGTPYHPIQDNSAIIHEGLRQLLGVWDHIKNKGDHGADNYGLEFVGFWPYKRECRRILGDFVLTQDHLQNPAILEDTVAYGVWFVDIHTHGILDRGKAPYSPPFADENWDAKGTRCYGIPLRALYSRNISNLMMAGRPISASYVAFSSTRVLCTGSVVGQAVGVAASLCAKYNKPPRAIAHDHVKECQQLILRQDGYLPGVVNDDPDDLARRAAVTASSEAPLVFPPPNEEEEMRLPLAQIFPVSARRLTQVKLLLRSELDRDAEIQIGVRRAAHVWDFRSDGDIARGRARVPARHDGWVACDLRGRVEPGRLYYLHTTAQPGVFWKLFHESDDDLVHRCPVAVAPASLPGRAYWRPIRDGRSFCMKITPQSRPFAAGNVVRGTNRPDTWTNLWSSDPAMSLPAWIELRWTKPVAFNTIQLTFDTNMNRRVRRPLFRYPECVRDYLLELHDGRRWVLLHEERDNYMRRRVHTFERHTATRLRLTVLATNGVPNARIYEVRVYDDGVRPNAARQIPLA